MYRYTFAVPRAKDRDFDFIRFRREFQVLSIREDLQFPLLFFVHLRCLFLSKREASESELLSFCFSGPWMNRGSQHSSKTPNQLGAGVNHQQVFLPARIQLPRLDRQKIS
jgi:hypothetical protein